MNPRLLSLWAKSNRDNPQNYYPLIYHMLDVGATAEKLYPMFAPFDHITLKQAAYIAAIHDLGKADPCFQSKVPELAQRVRESGIQFDDNTKSFRHEARSADWIKEQPWAGDHKGIVSRSVRAHHGNYRACCENDDDGSREPWISVRNQLADIVRERMGIPDQCLKLLPPLHAGVATIKLAGLIVLADWIASNQELFGYSFDSQFEWNPDHYQLSLQRAEKAITSLRLSTDRAITSSGPPKFGKIWQGFSQLRPTQQVLENTVLEQSPPPGLAIIEAPMGDGKTEAALYLAEHWHRLRGMTGAYIALPTMATSNQMHDRYKRFLETLKPGGTAPRLIHGAAWLLEEDAPEAEPLVYDEDNQPFDSDWFRNTKRALIAPEGVGTIDQALLATLNVKHGFLRLFSLSRKVLIIDEAHAYDVYMNTILKRLLQWCAALGVPVILLSATLSQKQRAELIEAYTGEPTNQEENAPSYPLITLAECGRAANNIAVETGVSSQKTLKVVKHLGLMNDTEQIARLATSLTEEGGCLCVLMNTVRQAQDVYNALKLLNPEERLLFHARFRNERRAKIEKKVIHCFGKGDNRPKRVILVATQVVEQSLDIDFDGMITQLAPIDLLLQRSGRVHRHEGRSRPSVLGEPCLHVLLPEITQDDIAFGSSGRVYLEETLLRTLAILEQREQFNLPQDFRTLIEACYGDATPVSSWVKESQLSQAQQLKLKKMQEMESFAKEHLIPMPKTNEFVLPTKRVVPEAEEGEGAHFLRAGTRWGDDSLNVLVIHDKHMLGLLSQKRAPKRADLKRLLLQQARIASYWISDLSDNDKLRLRGPDWLRNYYILDMTQGDWQAKDKHNNSIKFIDSDELGLMRIQDKQG